MIGGFLFLLASCNSENAQLIKDLQKENEALKEQLAGLTQREAVTVSENDGVETLGLNPSRGELIQVDTMNVRKDK